MGEEEEKRKRKKRQDEEGEEEENGYKDKSKLSFITEVLDFVSSGDLGKTFRESEAYMDWKFEQEELGWPQEGEDEENEEELEEEEEVHREPGASGTWSFARLTSTASSLLTKATSGTTSSSR